MKHCVLINFLIVIERAQILSSLFHTLIYPKWVNHAHFWKRCYFVITFHFHSHCHFYKCVTRFCFLSLLKSWSVFIDFAFRVISILRFRRGYLRHIATVLIRFFDFLPRFSLLSPFPHKALGFKLAFVLLLYHFEYDPEVFKPTFENLSNKSILSLKKNLPELHES